MTESKARLPGARIPELDGIRGAAVLYVVIGHYFYFSPAASHQPSDLLHRAYVYWERYALAGSWTGVDLFFVLSGFLIGGILLDAKNSPNYYKTFYLRRFFRIIPLYYLLIFSYVAVIAFAGPFLRAHSPDWGPEPRYQIPIHLLFLQNFGLLKLSAIGVPWLASTWSLAVEEQFYLLAPLAIRMFSKRSLYAFLIAFILAAPPFRIWCHYHFSTLNLAYTLMPCRADDLAMGILAALLWREEGFHAWVSRDGAKVLWVLLGAAVLGVVALEPWLPESASIQMQSIGYSWMGFFYVMILLVTLLRPAGPIAWTVRLGFLREFGRISYCLYVIHELVHFLCDIFLRLLVRRVESWEGIATAVFSAILAYGIARLSWTYFEHPLLRRGHAFRY